MPSVSNKTRRPLVIPLPGGKKLHLGPGRAADIAANAVAHPALKKLVDAGEVEIDTAESSATNEFRGGGKQHAAQGHDSKISRRGGDR